MNTAAQLQVPRDRSKELNKGQAQGPTDYLAELKGLRVPRSGNGLGYASIFCGGGGLDLGFALAGYAPLFSSDIEPTYCETISRNLGEGHISEPHDVSELSGDHLDEILPKRPDVIIGGPPCQSFSILGDRKALNDPRGRLAHEYARLIGEVRPEAFVFENVPGILNVNGGKDWENILECFGPALGYHIHWTKLNAVAYGAPQIRQRVVAVGFRTKKRWAAFGWPEPRFAASADEATDGLPAPRTAAEALRQVDGLPNHVLRKHGERVASRYSTVPPGGRDKADHTDRIHPARPSGTVLVGSGGGGGRPFIHPTEHRHITVREAARLQSFPDWWEFAGGATAAYRQVGNAVPPLMAKAIANKVQSALQS